MDVGFVVAVGDGVVEVVDPLCDVVCVVGPAGGCGDAGVDDVEEGVGSDRAVGVEVGGDCVGGEGTGDGVTIEVGVGVGVGPAGAGIGVGVGSRPGNVGEAVGPCVPVGVGVTVGVDVMVGLEGGVGVVVGDGVSDG